MKKIFQNIIATVFNDLPHKHAVWLEAIKDQDDLLALQSATRGLESVVTDPSIPIKIRSRIIDEASKKTRPILRKVNLQFIRFEYMDSHLENNILSIAYGFHKVLYANYLSLLDDFVVNPVAYETTALHKLLSEIVTQAFEMAKWRSFVNLSLTPKVWLQLHQIYRLANDYDLLDKSLDADDVSDNFNNDSGSDLDGGVDNNQYKSTLAAQLVQTYMLDSLQQANLSRHGVDIICKILQQQLLHVEISQDFNPIKFLFYVDLDKDMGAKRIRHFTPTNSCIYWQIDDIEKEITLILDSSMNNPALKLLSKSLSLEPHQVKAIPDTWGAILREWSRKEYQRQRRKEDRKKLTSTASVTYGIQNVCERVKVHENKKLTRGARVSADGKSLDERLRNHAIIHADKFEDERSNHHWVIVDESSRGMGAIASSELNTWITVGQLVALVMADSQQEILVAVIRSAKPKANRQIQVGLEVLSRHAKWIQLSLVQTIPTPDTITSTALSHPQSFSGLYLPIEAELSSASSLLLPKIEFVAHAQYEISIAGMIETATLADSVDSKDDWVKLTYPG